jgi:hypothetical protein
MKKLLPIYLFVVLSFCLAPFVSAQAKLTGSITGQVVDVDENPLPGCSVTVEGPALQGTMSFTTTTEGNFRFPAIPPGEGYECTFEMPGFKILVRKGLKVSVGKTTNVNIILEMSTIQEEVTVVGESPTVDVKVSKTSVNYSNTYIYNIPFARDLYSVLNSIPGSVSENKSYRRTSNIAGGTVRGNQYLLDGVTLNDPAVMYPMTNINIDIYEEVEMGLFGHPADVGIADGGYINIVSKSGGDEFHGGATVEYYNEDMQESLINEEDLNAVGLEKPTGWKSWQDYSLFLGGPIIKDRIWFFTNARFFRWALDWSHIIWDETQTAGERIYTTDEAPHKEYNIFGKLTFQLTPNVRLMTSYNFIHLTEDFFTNGISPNYDISYTSTWDGEIGHTISGQLNWVFNQNLFFDLRIGYISRWFPLPFSPYALPDAPIYYDRYYGIYTNSSREEETYLRNRFNPSIVATLFLDDFFNAMHEVKLGVEFEDAYGDVDLWKENPWQVYFYRGSIYAYATSTIDNRGRIWANIIGNTEGSSIRKGGMRRFGLFIQDNITIAQRLTLNLGIRFDTSKSYYPEQYHAAVNDPYGLLPFIKDDSDRWDEYTLERMDALRWTHLSPRIGFSLDLLGDGKSVLRASWSRYNEYMMLQYTALVNPFHGWGGDWLWFDLNYNENFDPPPTDNYYALYLDPSVSEFEMENEMDVDATAPYTDEFAIGIEQEIANELSLGLTFIYKHKQNIFEDVNDYGLGKDEAWKGYRENSPYWEKFEFLDPGDDGEFNTEDDTISYVYSELSGAPDIHYYLTNIEGGYRKYWAINFIVNKRMSNNWQLLGSVVYSKAWGNIGGGFGETIGASANFDSPNAWVYSGGRLDFDRPWNIKLQSTVILPYDFIISGYFNHLSGDPWARTIGVYIPFDPKYKYPAGYYGNIRTELIGARRNASVTTLDLRFEKRFRVGENMYFGGYIDIMNALGNSGYKIQSDPGGYLDYSDPENPAFIRRGTYGDISSAYGTRIIKVSFRFTF